MVLAPGEKGREIDSTLAVSTQIEHREPAAETTQRHGPTVLTYQSDPFYWNLGCLFRDSPRPRTSTRSCRLSPAMASTIQCPIASGTTTRVDSGRMIQNGIPNIPSSRLCSHVKGKPYLRVVCWRLSKKPSRSKLRHRGSFNFAFQRVNFQRCSSSTKTSRVIYYEENISYQRQLRLYGNFRDLWIDRLGSWFPMREYVTAHF